MGSAIYIEYHRAGITGQKIPVQGGDLLISQAFRFFQQRKEIVDVRQILAAVVHHHPAVRQGGEGAGLSGKGRYL